MVSESAVVPVLIGALALIVVVAFAIAARTLLRSRYSPVAYVKAFIHAETPLQIASPLSPIDVKTRLQGELSRFGIPFLMPTRLVGFVKAEELKIQFHRPFVSNPFSPVLTGEIRALDGQTLISGTYRLPVFMRWFMTVWFGFLGLWSAFGIPGGLLLLIAGESVGAAFGLGPFLIYGAAILMVKRGVAVGRSDREQIESRIAGAIGGTVAQR